MTKICPYLAQAFIANPKNIEAADETKRTFCLKNKCEAWHEETGSQDGYCVRIMNGN